MKTNKYVLLIALLLGVCLTGCKKDDPVSGDKNLPGISSIVKNEKDQYQKVPAKGAMISIPVIDHIGNFHWYVERLHTYDKGLVIADWPMIQATGQYDRFTPVTEHTINGDWFRVWRTDNLSLNIEFMPNGTKSPRELRLYLTGDSPYSSAILIHQIGE